MFIIGFTKFRTNMRNGTVVVLNVLIGHVRQLHRVIASPPWFLHVFACLAVAK